jgi:hypothetical protein
MLLELIARYYTYLWIALIAIGLLKLILTYIFLEGGGMNFVVWLFKWVGEDEQEVEDEPSRRSMMKTLNLVSILLYILLLVFVAATLLLFILKR